jgi:hypothetical protein
MRKNNTNTKVKSKFKKYEYIDSLWFKKRDSRQYGSVLALNTTEKLDDGPKQKRTKDSVGLCSDLINCPAW